MTFWIGIPCLLIIVVLSLFTVRTRFAIARWTSETARIRRRVESGADATITPRSASSSPGALPSCVERYLRAVLPNDLPPITSVELSHAGLFNLGEHTDRWKPFESTQHVALDPPGFDWDGRIHLFPGCTAFVRDAYLHGQGTLLATLWGWIPLARQSGSGEIAHAELMRFLAEAVWYPFALLPGNAVRWEPETEKTALAHLRHGSTTASLRFLFDEAGLVHTVQARSRARMQAEKLVPTAWEGRWWDYQSHHGVRIPHAGEVAWILPEGRKPYWRGRLEFIRYGA